MMAANTGERTLTPALIPPRAAHIHGIYSAGGVEGRALALALGSLSSLLADFAIRAVPKATISPTTVERCALAADVFEDAILLRVLRLNCLTSAYAGLWDAALPRADDEWAGGVDYPGRPALAGVPDHWDATVPLRRASDRRQALLELDVLAAMCLRVSADELVTVYRTQFPVLAGYDRLTVLFDANGRVVPSGLAALWRKPDGVAQLDASQRTVEHLSSGVSYTYELPFRPLDREQDMRAAYAEFERRAASRSENTS